MEDESSRMGESSQASNSSCCTETEAQNSAAGPAEALAGPLPSASNLCYEAESPDEAALVYAARAYRCTLQSRTPEQVTVDFAALGSLTFQLLHILPFDSVRKRMSVVVRHPLSKEVVVYTKGADSVIMELLSVAAPGRLTQWSWWPSEGLGSQPPLPSLLVKATRRTWKGKRLPRGRWEGRGLLKL